MYQQVDTSFTANARAHASGKNVPPRIDRSTEFVQLTEKTIRKIADVRLVDPNIVSLFFRQLCTETALKIRKLSIRERDNHTAVKAYCALSVQDFDGINARQRWANWRVIPRNISGRLPNRPIFALDLCCGIGDSTEVLAYYAAPRSEILGIEYNPEFVKKAQQRRFENDTGAPANVTFRAQSALETFCGTDGSPLRNASVDWINCQGAVGSHFDCAATEIMLREIKRVLRPCGLATIDSGKDGTCKRDLIRLGKGAGFEPLHFAKSCLVDKFTQVCFSKA